MNSNEILKSDLLDILFDNRNKQYGAYTLRKTYNNRLSLSLGIALSLGLLLFFLFPNGKSSNSIIDQMREDLVVRTAVIPEEQEKIPDPPKKKPEVVQQVAQQQFTKILITDDKKVKDPIADQNTLLNSVISNVTKNGISVTGNPVINNPGPVNNGGDQPTTKPEVKPSREPEFPGGQEAWINFLRKNLVAPSELEVDETKTVKVRFVVDVDGSVTGFEIVQSAGRSFDNEVIRVLKKMPKWKPALQNGEPVEKYYTQPVTFIGVEQ